MSWRTLVSALMFCSGFFLENQLISGLIISSATIKLMAELPACPLVKAVISQLPLSVVFHFVQTVQRGGQDCTVSLFARRSGS